MSASVTSFRNMDGNIEKNMDISKNIHEDETLHNLNKRKYESMLHVPTEQEIAEMNYGINPKAESLLNKIAKITPNIRNESNEMFSLFNDPHPGGSIRPKEEYHDMCLNKNEMINHKDLEHHKYEENREMTMPSENHHNMYESEKVNINKNSGAAADSDEKRIVNIRKNIRDVMDENQLDSTTLAAQRDESRRLARVQEQQKIIREVQRQNAVEKQYARTQNRVMSLLQGEASSSKISNIIANLQNDKDSSHASGLMPDNDLTNDSENNQMSDDFTDSLNYQRKLNALANNQVANTDVVEISDSSSDDDCIILSDEEEEEDTGDGDDPHNSGLHINDEFNVPNEHGNIVVNIGHPSDESDIYVAPQIARAMKPHQVGGVRFLFDNIIESVERFKSSAGFGCILAHSMGLGKTLQLVCFCDIFLRYTDSKTILCVMPINTLQNWVSEFDLWLPEPSEYIHKNHEIRPRGFRVFVLNDQFKTLSSRAKVIMEWARVGGVLLIGYELFRVLSLKVMGRKKKDKRMFPERHETNYQKKNFEDMFAALVSPGPDLVVCDEGHRIKNSHASISVALKQIRSKRRIVLTGYPLQNNLLEYWCMVDFVRPNYLGTKTEFLNMFERPIQNGQCIDSTPQDIKLMRYRSHVLHSLLIGFVQRRSHVVLKNTLPKKEEYIVLIRMDSFQRKLYDTFMNEIVRTKSVPNPLKAFALCCKIWNHPDVLYNFLKRKERDLDLDLEETNKSKAEIENLNDKIHEHTKHVADNFYKPDIVQTPYQHEAYNNMSHQFPLAYDMYGIYDQKHHNTHQKYDNCSNFAYPQMSDASSSLYKANPSHYPGIVVNPTKNVFQPKFLENVSSEILDLETKEIKKVETFAPHLGNTATVKETTEDIPNDVSKNKGESFEWASELMKSYVPDLIENSPKMVVFFCLLEESVKLKDKVLVFSQSLLTLNVMEKFLQSRTIPGYNHCWIKNLNYFRLDGSTPAMEREKLINEFNKNNEVQLFLVSTRAGSLGINLVGANRVIVFDASWNPCHDTQAVCRVYRYGQLKPCFIYRIVMDNCLEKKIYDRQVNKQGMSDRVVDECNPDAHLSLKEVTNLCYDDEGDTEVKDFSESKDKYLDSVMQIVIQFHSKILSREPFYHESLLVDRKERKLSSAEKRLAQRGYEIEKRATSKTTNLCNYLPRGQFKPGEAIDPTRIDATKTWNAGKTETYSQAKPGGSRQTRWIPADVWQRQGMTAQEMTLPLDVVIPTSSGEKSNIILKAGQKVMVLKSLKGIYMQLETGKIIAIRTSIKMERDNENNIQKPENNDKTNSNNHENKFPPPYEKEVFNPVPVEVKEKPAPEPMHLNGNLKSKPYDGNVENEIHTDPHFYPKPKIPSTYSVPNCNDHINEIPKECIKLKHDQHPPNIYNTSLNVQSNYLRSPLNAFDVQNCEIGKNTMKYPGYSAAPLDTNYSAFSLPIDSSNTSYYNPAQHPSPYDCNQYPQHHTPWQ